ncbi:hypothetical protein [Ruegeria marina]|uniref:Tetratricopeptide repeat-containing protein n=1 Tax=Ruegeria marina TaxID=639004 RepID=A0A1G7CEY4_9RHOB|nr:hypothetical protein [Ruegeria marina]SDE37300.1 hypothetical protein SAMN04488239_1188 [Ruegeria marina]
MNKIWKPALAGALWLVLSSCDEGAVGPDGFQREYTTSRNALETGKFDKASRGYARLLQNSGRYEPWVRLEYSHALLRANEFQAAAEQARTLAASQTGPARSAALVVQGTAEHELGMTKPGAEGDAYLRSARAALTEALNETPELDRYGALTARKARLDQQLGG